MDEQQNLHYSLFASHDEMWKSVTFIDIKNPRCTDISYQTIPSEADRHFGLFEADGTLKPHNMYLVGNKIGNTEFDLIYHKKNTNELHVIIDSQKDTSQDYMMIFIGFEDDIHMEKTVKLFKKNELLDKCVIKNSEASCFFKLKPEFTNPSYNNLRIEIVNNDSINPLDDYVIWFRNAFAEESSIIKQNNVLPDISIGVFNQKLVCYSQECGTSITDIVFVSILVLSSIITGSLGSSYWSYRKAMKIKNARTSFLPREHQTDTCFIMCFIDLEKSTMYEASLSNEDIEKKLTEFYNNVEHIINNYHGNKIKRIGDAEFFYFKNTKDIDYRLDGKLEHEHILMVIQFCKAILESYEKLQTSSELGRYRVSMVYDPAKEMFDKDGKIDLICNGVNLASKANELASGEEIVINKDLYEILNGKNPDFEFSHKGYYWTNDKYRHEIFSMKLIRHGKYTSSSY